MGMPWNGEEPPKGFKRLQKAQKGQESTGKPLRGRKRLEKASKGSVVKAGSALARNEKCDLLVLKSMVLGTPPI